MTRDSRLYLQPPPKCPKRCDVRDEPQLLAFATNRAGEVISETFLCPCCQSTFTIRAEEESSR